MRSIFGAKAWPVLVASLLPAGALADKILSTNGFSKCYDNSKVKVQKLDVKYNADTRELDFDVAGMSTEEMKVKAKLIVTAYGNEIYTQSFNPCDYDMPEMCPRRSCRDNRR